LVLLPLAGSFFTSLPFPFTYLETLLGVIGSQPPWSQVTRKLTSPFSTPPHSKFPVTQVNCAPYYDDIVIPASHGPEQAQCHFRYHCCMNGPYGTWLRSALCSCLTYMTTYRFSLEDYSKILLFFLGILCRLFIRERMFTFLKLEDNSALFCEDDKIVSPL
jgi:hypothetical protein